MWHLILGFLFKFNALLNKKNGLILFKSYRKSPDVVIYASNTSTLWSTK